MGQHLCSRHSNFVAMRDGQARGQGDSRHLRSLDQKSSRLFRCANCYLFLQLDTEGTVRIVALLYCLNFATDLRTKFVFDEHSMDVLISLCVLWA
jgi:hypothetical protein